MSCIECTKDFAGTIVMVDKHNRCFICHELLVEQNPITKERSITMERYEDRNLTGRDDSAREMRKPLLRSSSGMSPQISPPLGNPKRVPQMEIAVNLQVDALGELETQLENLNDRLDGVLSQPNPKVDGPEKDSPEFATLPNDIRLSAFRIIQIANRLKSIISRLEV